MAVEAELKRRNQSGDLVDWIVNDDGSEPTSDLITHTKLDALLALLAPQELTWYQGVSDDVWTIVHNLGFLPSVDVIRSDGAQVIGFAVQHISNNELTVTFSGAMTGLARLS